MLQALGKCLVRDRVEWAYTRLKKAKKQARHNLLAYAFVERLPNKYRKDMLGILDDYEKQLS